MTYTIESILDEYRENNFPAFTIHEGKERRKIYEGKEIEEGEEILERFLRTHNGNFKIRIYKSIPKSGIDDKTPAYLCLPYSKTYTPEEKSRYYQESGVGHHLVEEIRSLRAEVSGLKSQLDEEPETDEELQQEAQPGSVIGQIMGNPAVQNMIAAFLTNISANMFSNHVAPQHPHQQQQQQYPRPQAMAGIPDDISTVIESLISKGVTIEDFQKLDAMPPDRLSFLLSMLRNQ